MDIINRVGIMGGTFNPIHNGHILLAQAAKEYLSLDCVLFIPTGDSYMKSDVLSADARYQMTELAIADYPEFLISDVEMKRKGHSYTYETLEILRHENPDTEYYFIMGADSLFAIEKWYHPDLICEQCTLVCAVRDDTSIDALQKQKDRIEQLYFAKVILLPFDKVDISSTEIREACKDDMDISSWVPAGVAQYIKDKKLYQ